MRPTPRCLLLFAAGFPLAALPLLLGPELWTPWIAWMGGCSLLLGIDAILGLPARRLDVAVVAPAVLFVGAQDEVEVTLQPRSRSGTRAVEVLLDLSPLLVPQSSTNAPLQADAPTRVTVDLVPLRRGTCRIERVWLRWAGPLGLMSRRRIAEQELEVAVVPNIHAVRGAALQWARERDTTQGTQLLRLVGEGSEFDAMREYVPGMDHRAINWSATARHRKLICQDFRSERNHQVIIAFDTGYLMSEPMAGLPKLDHAIHAGLLLGQTSARAGDKVGMYAFDERARGYVAPEAGMRGFRRMQQTSAELEYTTTETNFTLGLAELAARLARRSLVVLMTDFVDTVTAELMVENVTRLARKHLVVFVTLRDPDLDRVAGQLPGSLEALHQAVVAGDFVRERDLVLRRLEHLGVFVIDTPPNALSTSLLNRYFAIKRRELI